MSAADLALLRRLEAGRGTDAEYLQLLMRNQRTALRDEADLTEFIDSRTMLDAPLSVWAACVDARNEKRLDILRRRESLAVLCAPWFEAAQ